MPWGKRVLALATTLIGVALTVGCSDNGGVELQADWWLSGEPSGLNLPVVVYVGSSSCNDFNRVEVAESAGEVTVTAYVDANSDGDCTADYTWHPSPVELDASLNGRALRGCTAPADGHRAPDLEHDDVDCRTLIRPDGA